MHRTLNVESGIEKMFDMMSEMTWLRIEGDAVVVESETYIRDQPVAYEQVKGVIDEIRRRGEPVHARIHVEGLRIARVDIIGVVRIIWELHKETEDENLLSSIELVGASPRVLYVWETLKTNLPRWIRVLDTRIHLS